MQPVAARDAIVERMLKIRVLEDEPSRCSASASRRGAAISRFQLMAILRVPPLCFFGSVSVKTPPS